jgi:pimeloyl-ACP methyl ester carboxylesterase
MLPDPDSRFLDNVLDDHRDSPLEALAAVDTAELGTEARGALALLRNRDPDRVQSLVDQVEGMAARMARLSPQSVVDRVEVPVTVLHDERDRFVPAQQSQLMRDAVAGRRNFRFFRTRLLEHTEPAPPGRNPIRFAGEYVPGLVSLYRFAHGPLAGLKRRHVAR